MSNYLKEQVVISYDDRLNHGDDIALKLALKRLVAFYLRRVKEHRLERADVGITIEFLPKD